MRRLTRALLWTGGVVAAVAVALIVWEPLTATLPAPDAAVRHDAVIRRDSFGVPHIRGVSDADTAYGLAYANAEDDFATLEEILAAVRGRAGALTGAEGAKLDYVGALLGAPATAAQHYGDLSPATRALVEGYAAGLNRYAATHPGELRLRRLFPVTGRDIVAGFVLRSPFFFGLDRVLGRLADDKLPDRDAEPVAERGSNAFAVAPGRSGDGVTRLLSNSHQPWSGGVAWYEAVVQSDAGWHFAGALFPGMPFPALGHNATLGWTNTVNRADLIDTYRLTLTDGGARYRFDGTTLPLERRRIWLRVRFGPFVLPVPRTIARSIHGPVVENARGAFAVRYAGFGDVRQVEQYYRLNRARDFAEWRAAMAMQAVPATNFIYADAAGHIAYVYNAHFPHRAPGFDWKGVLPGDTRADLWTRYEPFSTYPQLIDPTSGWVANSNNTPFIATDACCNLDPAKFAAELGIENRVTNRSRRWAELTQGLGVIDRATLLRIKFDTGYSRDGWAGKRMAAMAALDLTDAPALARARALLLTWDYTQDGVGAADAIAALMLNDIAHLTYWGETPPDARASLTDHAAFLMQHFGRLDPPLGALQRVRRGTADAAVLGGPDALRAIHSKQDDTAGRLIGRGGDSFIMLVEWGGAGEVHSQSVQPFGAAVSRPASKHYNDQLALFARQGWKPVWFTEAELRGHVEREYRPKGVLPPAGRVRTR